MPYALVRGKKVCYNTREEGQKGDGQEGVLNSRGGQTLTPKSYRHTLTESKIKRTPLKLGRARVPKGRAYKFNKGVVSQQRGGHSGEGRSSGGEQEGKQKNITNFQKQTQGGWDLTQESQKSNPY